MKRITGLLFFVLVVSSSLFANEYESDENIGNNVALEENRERRFSFMTSPMILLNNFSGHTTSVSAIGNLRWFYMDMEFQYGINETFNFSLTTAFSIRSFATWDDRHVTYQFILKPMLIYRPFRTGLDGFYIGWYSNIGWQQIQKSEQIFWNLYTHNFMQVGTGLNVGYKWIFRNGFTVQLGTGIGKTWNIPNHNPVQIGRSIGIHRRIFQFRGVDQADGRRTFDYLDFRILDFKLGFSF